MIERLMPKLKHIFFIQSNGGCSMGQVVKII